MDTFSLRAWANNTFRWTTSLSAISALFDLPNCIIRMQFRQGPLMPIILEFSTPGNATYNNSLKTVSFFAPISSITNLSGLFQFDIRIERPSGSSDVIATGDITFNRGITRLPGDATQNATEGAVDTVEVVGKTSQALVVQAANLTMISPVDISAGLSAWLDTLPTDPTPLAAGVWWNNGGIPTRASGAAPQ